MNTAFPRVGRLSHGYKPTQVDAFLEQVEAGLSAGRLTSRTTAAAIRKAAFDLVLRGYDCASVDAALDGLEVRALAVEARVRAEVSGELSARAAPASGPPRSAPPTAELDSEAAHLRRRLGEPTGSRFPHTGRLRRGYSVSGVDALLDRLSGPLQATPGIEADAVRRSVFRPQRGGYDEDAVDDYLDRVVDVLMRRAVGVGPRPGP